MRVSPVSLVSPSIIQMRLTLSIMRNLVGKFHLASESNTAGFHLCNWLFCCQWHSSSRWLQENLELLDAQAQPLQPTPNALGPDIRPPEHLQHCAVLFGLYVSPTIHHNVRSLRTDNMSLKS